MTDTNRLLGYPEDARILIINADDLGMCHAELQTIEPDSWQVRQTDLDFLMSPEARAIIRQGGIILLGYRPLQRLWQG